MRETASADAVGKAFRLAYFILGDRTSSILAAMAAMDKLKTASTTQDRRLYYTPTGRSAGPAARTKINLTEMPLLQRLVYFETELFERLLEGKPESVHQEDMIIRFIKHLIRITTKHNSFYVALGVCRLLYNYTTSETSEIYNLVIQDPDRIRDDYYYRSVKKRVMHEIKDRFGSLVRTQRGLHREERFRAQENSQDYVSLVKECLTRFTPWQSFCVLPKDLDPKRHAITPLLFEGEDPDKEHNVELNRIHTLSHPACFERLASALRFDSPYKRLELPHFLVTGGSPPSEDRFNPQGLSEGEMDAIGHYLKQNSIRRNSSLGDQLKVVVDGVRHSEFELDRRNSFQFDVEDGCELIEIRSVEGYEETCLAICPLVYDQSGIVPLESSIGVRNRLSLRIEPTMEPAGAGGATVTLSYRRTTSTIAISQLFGNSFYESFKSTLRSNIFLRLAFGFLLIGICVAGWWTYLHSRNTKPSTTLVAEQRGSEEERRSSPPPSSPQTQQAPPRQEGEPPKTVGSGSGQHSGLRPDSATTTEGTRGRKLRPASATLPAIRRVHVDQLGADYLSQQIRENLIGALRSSDRFIVVTNRDDADAVFKGSVKHAKGNRAPSSIVLELVNAGGQVIWSLSSEKAGHRLSADIAEDSRFILKVLLSDIQRLEGKR